MSYDASSIDVLEGLDPVRKRPGMYIGSTGSRGLNHLIYEILDNSIDEHLAGYCDEIHVTLEKNGYATIEDNGRGIPVDMHQKGVSAERVIMTTLHAGGKFNNSSYKVSGGLHGVGSSVVNALSEHLVIQIYKDGFIYEDEYKRGIPIKELQDGLLPVQGKTKKTGTKTTFLPDKEIFEKIYFKRDAIKQRLHELAYLNPKLTIYFANKRAGEEEEIVYHEEDGLVGFINELNDGKQTVNVPPIYFKGNMENMELEVAMQYTDTFEETFVAFCNNINTPDGGTHVTGFKSSLTQIINSYARELGILKEKDSNFTGPDTRCGLTAVISLKHPDPQFEGQTKTKLGNSDASRVVSAVTKDELTRYFDRNIETLKNCISCAERSAKIRKTEERAKNNLLTKQSYSFDSNGKLTNCESKEYSKNEIFIVEGDSAGGSAKTARNRKHQAILPIRGKILNVEKATIDKVLANAEIRSMINAFGCGFSEGYGNDFDISKLKYDKIIIMADADVDGAHISTLLLTLFYRFMPELIETGHVYIAMPPLYKATPKRGEAEYLYDDASLEKYRKTHKNFDLQRYKGLGEMDAEQLWDTTMNPETRMLKRVSIDSIQSASKMTELLMGSEVEPRRNYIKDNAISATLDV